MGKKRIAKKGASGLDRGKVARAVSRTTRKKFVSGILHIQATFNNTKMILTDPNGNALAWSSSGQLGFKGARKGTPFASSKVAEVIADKATQIGMKDVTVIVNGVGAGRESGIRSFAGKGFGISSISDITPVPHNGPRPKKARRV